MRKTIETSTLRQVYRFDSKRAVLELLPEVSSIARRIHAGLPKTVDIEDLRSAGVVGLMEAAAKFSPEKKVPLLSFASFRIRGAMLDSLRTGDWAPRSLRRKSRAVQEAIRTLSARLDRLPTEEEIAAELRTSLHLYQKLVGELDTLTVESMYRQSDESLEEEESAYASVKPEDDPLFCSIREETKERLTGAIAGLSDQERHVTTLYYYEELTTPEIGLVLGETKEIVQKIRLSAMRHLRLALSHHETTRRLQQLKFA